MTDPLPQAENCQYAACYCEENVYKLVENVSLEHPTCLGNTWVVFISNSGRCVPLWNQKAGRKGDGLVVWDYHVILLYRKDDKTRVYDLDTRLPFPAEFPAYSEATLGSEEQLEIKFHRKFRVISGPDYLANLSSDRRHMKTEDGWLQPPPSWPCIKGNHGEEHNLDSFIDMDKEHSIGKIYNLDGFVGQFS